jgi:hypothetical protein
MVKILFSLLLFIGTPAYAEEVAPEPIAEAPAPAIETPAPAIETPAPVIGGWAVIDPDTGNVHGVIVCDNAFCGEGGTLNGVMPYEFMGCKAGCILRHQTNATSDGNVAGWHGTTFHSDDSGNTTYSNNGSVKWDESDKTYSITSETNNLDGSKIKQKSKLKAEKTASDGNDLNTGFVKVETEYESPIINSQSGKIKAVQDSIYSNPNLQVEYSNDVRLSYESVESFKSNIDNDSNTAFQSETNSEVASTFVEITQKIKEFVNGFFKFITG